MTETSTLVVGASISGLASAAALQHNQIDYAIIEQAAQIATPWRNHYERLHLHTNKRISHLPYRPFATAVPRYPSRRQLLQYLEEYQQAFNIQPYFNTQALAIRREGQYWITETTKGIFRSANLVMATGPFSKPKPIDITGIANFSGTVLHSYSYQSGRDFKGQRVLVIGFGNSACEIAMDLHEQGAIPLMSVRSPVNIVPRDIAGIPILEISRLMESLPPRLADIINAPLIRLLTGNIKRYGLKKKKYGPLEEIAKNGQSPVLDIGTLQLIREGHIRVFGDIVGIEGNSIEFTDGRRETADSIVACIGYYRDYASFLHVDASRFADLTNSIARQQYFGKDGLYFCGYRISPVGQINEISGNAVAIARHIVRNRRSDS